WSFYFEKKSNKIRSNVIVDLDVKIKEEIWPWI
nr:hypothetical protein [Tanacetum cinerariifolium]